VLIRYNPINTNKQSTVPGIRATDGWEYDEAYTNSSDFTKKTAKTPDRECTRTSLRNAKEECAPGSSTAHMLARTLLAAAHYTKPRELG